MSEHESEHQSGHQSEGISDEQLPEDLRPSEDNPLAEPLDDDVEVDDLDMGGGKTPEQSEDDQQDDQPDDQPDDQQDSDEDD